MLKILVYYINLHFNQNVENIVHIKLTFSRKC